jgi:hypothetical protein
MMPRDLLSMKELAPDKGGGHRERNYQIEYSSNVDTMSSLSKHNFLQVPHIDAMVGDNPLGWPAIVDTDEDERDGIFWSHGKSR